MNSCLVQVIDDWRYIARVIDRLLLYIFLIVTLAGTLGIFFKVRYGNFRLFEVKRTLLLSVSGCNAFPCSTALQV